MRPGAIKTVEDAVAAIRPDDSIGFGLGPGIPGEFLHRLSDRDDYTSLEMSGALLTDLYEIFTRPEVRYRSGFFGPAERFLRDSGAVIEFVPADFRRFEPILAELAPRVMCVAAAAPDANGRMSLSLHAGATVDELHRCAADKDRVLIVEYSEHFPRTKGLTPEHSHAVYVDEADIVFESDRLPFVLEEPEISDVERTIAELAAAFVPDGATLQTGIGAIPSMIATLLAEGSGGGYGVHSEMFTTGLMALHEAGKVTNRTGHYDGISVTTFAAGTTDLYEWLDRNEEVRFLPVSAVNDPAAIAANPQMITINGAIGIDLAGQVVADTIGGRQFSGIGGHEDFLSGPGLELEDRALLCLPSTAATGGEVRSRIMGRFPEGSIVSTPRHQLDVVITEYGSAELQGRTLRERARALAAIAHPDFRDELSAVAEEWPAD